MRLARMCGVPFPSEAVYCAGPVTRTRQVASVTRSMMSSRPVAGATSADGGVNSTLANALLTAQLKGILPQFVLTVTGGLGRLAGGEVVPPEEVEKIGLPEVRDLVSATLFIDQQGEGDPCLVAKEPSVVDVPKTDCGEAGTGFPNLRFQDRATRAPDCDPGARK